MTWWNRLNVMRKWLLVGGLGSIACVVVACSVMQRTTDPQQTADATPPATDTALVQKATREAAPIPDRQAERPTAPPKKPTPPQPLSPETIKVMWARGGLTSDQYHVRLEALRSLFQEFRRHGHLDEAMVALRLSWEAVEAREGLAMAQRVALAEAGNLAAKKDHRAAVEAYGLLLDRYGDGRFAAEAAYHLGGCHLELHDYAAAERTWQRLVEEHDGSHFAAMGWRKLALAQTLQGRFDTALATLEVMAARHGDSHYGEYARMRRGYVQARAGRRAEARQTYARFLTEFPHSRYYRLVGKQMKDLEEEAKNLARAGS